MPDVAPLGLGPTGDPVDVRDRVAVDGAVSVELAPWTARPAGWRRRCAAEGKTKKDAVRSLKRHISNAVYRQLLIDAAPAKSEARPGGHQERRSSTVAGFLPAHRLFGPSHFPDPTSHRTPSPAGRFPVVPPRVETRLSGNAKHDQERPSESGGRRPRQRRPEGQSPARGIKLPQVPKTDVVPLHPEELHRLAAALPDRWQPMVYVSGACGLRFSEVAGLRVARLDMAGLRLQVLETAPQAGGDRAEPKTAAGRRTVPVPGLIAEILDEHLQRSGLAGEPDALVFGADRGRAPQRRRSATVRGAVGGTLVMGFFALKWGAGGS